MSEIRVTSVVGENGGDRVGLTTGLTVGPLTGTTGIGATITHQGHAQFAGVCTATSFVGNGAGLTNVSAGKILQVKQSVKTDTQSFSTGSNTLSDSFFDITGLSVTLTPASGTKCFVSYSVTVGGEAGYGGGLALFRDSTQVFRGPSAGSRVRLSNFVQQHEQNQLDVLSNQFLDTHGANGSTAVTYKLQMYVATPGRTTRVNRGQTWSDSRAFGSIISQITVMEVGA